MYLQPLVQTILSPKLLIPSVTCRSAPSGGGFICVKNIIVSTELGVDDDFEMIAVELKGMDHKYAWKLSIFTGCKTGWEDD
jgi:hypothetical protein